jgi:hypothetical protein
MLGSCLPTDAKDDVKEAPIIKYATTIIVGVNEQKTRAIM